MSHKVAVTSVPALENQGFLDEFWGVSSVLRDFVVGFLGAQINGL